MNPQTTPSVTVAVIVRNEERYIRKCIESLLQLDYPKDDFEILIVDGISKDRTQKIVREFPVRLIINKDKRTAPGRNLAIENARGKYLAFTDGDCEVDKNWLKVLMEAVKNAPENVVAVGGPNLVFDDDPIFAKVVGYMQETFLGSGGSPQAHKINEKKYVYSIPNCNTLYKKRGIDKEKFDPKLNIGSDADINFRLSQKGYKFLYLPNALVWHHRRTNLKNFVKRMFLYGKGMSDLVKKYKKSVRWYAFLPALMVIMLIAAYPLIVYFPWIGGGYLLAFSAYVIALIISAAYVYQKTSTEGFLLALVLLPIQHLSYGIGSLMGLVTTRGQF